MKMLTIRELVANKKDDCRDMKSYAEKEKNTKVMDIELNFPTNPACIGEVRDRILKGCLNAGLADEDAQDICLALVEAVTNAIRHSKCEEFTVLLTLSTKHAMIKVVDNGKGFSFSKGSCEFPANDAPGGRGLPIINSLVDNLIVESKTGSGTTVTMIKYLVDKQASA